MKVRCPKHDDEEPSCEVYEDHGYCYAGCGYISLEELGLGGNTSPVGGATLPRMDVHAEIRRISALPRKQIRGFELHYEASGYYVIWPEGNYFIKRLLGTNNGGKYSAPSGITRPPFWAAKRHNKTLFIVEGEINALSLSNAFPEYDVCSPGSASDLGSKKQEKYLTEYCQYEKIFIVVDEDAAGVQGAINLMAMLKNMPYKKVILTNPDCNDIYVNAGKEALRESIEKKMS